MSGEKITERSGKSQTEIESLPYYEDFKQLLGNYHRLLFQSEGQHIFYLYCLSQKIKHFFLEPQNYHIPPWKLSLQDAQGLILADPIVRTCLLKIKAHSSVRDSFKQQKDRKTSFFRTVLKHLKQGAKGWKNERGQLLEVVQRKLSKNTIASEDIAMLCSKFGTQILEYLESPEVFRDILVFNKSRANKLYYILHLDEITLATRSQSLPSYSFFLREDIYSEIKRIIRSHHSFWAESIERTERSCLGERQETMEDLFEVLDLEKREDGSERVEGSEKVDGGERRGAEKEEDRVMLEWEWEMEQVMPIKF